ncbi:MAG: uroporphyrinogen decarboxylase family protein [Anaerosomatales bacterium]|nr:uroporphyrinogen decarboxylase family protein [Anaerosomatales bacterium]MDT8435086.1 uroporphyrinogen decarboxylase family protein [Anaerosomatales bacterium]
MDAQESAARPHTDAQDRPAAWTGLLDMVRAAPRQMVFVTGGPPATPFAGPGPSTWMNPEYALHHARSWESPCVLGAMLPLEAAARPLEGAGSRSVERYRSLMTELAGSSLPVVAQVWGPLTMAATIVGLEPFVESLAGSSEAYSHLERGLEATLAVTEAALETHPALLWIGEPLAALASPQSLSAVWLPAMRQLLARSRAAGADPVVHVSGPATHVLDAVNRTGAGGMSITADTPLATAREKLSSHIVVFGNLDSMRLLDREEEWLREQGAQMAEEMRGRPFIATPGSAVPERIPVSRLAAFVEGARGI